MEVRPAAPASKTQPQLSNSIVVNLRECRYDIFRRVAQDNFKWETLLSAEYYQQQRRNTSDGKEPGDGCDSSFKQVTDRSLSTNVTSSKREENQIDKNNPNSQWSWDILWFDHGGLTPEFLSSMLPWQRVNHFLGMYNIARKNTLGIHLKRFIKEFPKDYNFFPNTWLYPAEFYDINEYYNQKAATRKQKLKDGEMSEAQASNTPIVLFICKPEASSQGKGIFIVRKPDEMRTALNQYLLAQYKQFQEYIQAQESYDSSLFYSKTLQYNQQNIFSVNQDQSQVAAQPSNQQQQLQQSQPEPPQVVEKNSSYVIQKYLAHPALINGHKFDFRIYVLITSVIEPLTIFVYRDGLVRLASEKYELTKNIADYYVHLTNYSLNKKNNNYDGDNHKLQLSECLKSGFKSASDRGTFVKTNQQIWKEIEDIVIKTTITIQPQLQHYYRMSQPKEPDLCYELLGFDIILDYKLKPWLLEVNHLPSFNSDTPTDEQVKVELIRDIYSILQLSIDHRKKVYREMKADQARQSQQQGCYKRLSVKEHCDRVRFDPRQVEKQCPKNKFKLVFPSANGDDDYDKYQRKANEIWQMTTGTYKQQQKAQKEKKKKSHKSRHRKQSQMLEQHNTADLTVGNIRKSSQEDEDDGQDATLNDVNSRLTKMGEPYQQARGDAKALSASAENGDTIILLNEKRAAAEAQASQTQQAFFDKRANQTTMKQQKFQKQNSQRYQFKSNIRQATSNPRSSIVSNNVQRQTPQTQTLKAKAVHIKHDDQKILSEPERTLMGEDGETVMDTSLDAANKLKQNNGQLKYKEYCKALIEDFNSAYYKSQFNQSIGTYQDNSRSIGHGLNQISSNINTIIMPPSSLLSHQTTGLTIYSMPTGPQQPIHTQNFGLQSSNNFLKKLNNAIQNQGRHIGVIQNRSNRQGFLANSMVSPGSLARSAYSKANPFQQQMIKCKEDLGIYSGVPSTINQHMLLRSDSINGMRPGVTVDMAPINMSAGVIDFKLQYKRNQQQQRRVNTGHNPTHPASAVQKKSQSKSLATNNPRTSQFSPKIKLHWINDTNDLVNYVTGSHNDDLRKISSLPTNAYRQKREQKNGRILSLENQSNTGQNLERLREYEKRLLSNTTAYNY